METFFISDTHFGHKNIINYSAEWRNRDGKPFRTIEEHDEYLVEQWNKTVTKDDKVYHLGDFCFGKRNIQYAGRLNGKKTLIQGNHDSYKAVNYLEHFDDVRGAQQFDNCILTHVPVHVGQLDRFIMNIHGHLHHENIDDWRYFNVSCEQIECTPMPYDCIIDRYAENTKIDLTVQKRAVYSEARQEKAKQFDAMFKKRRADEMKHLRETIEGGDL